MNNIYGEKLSVCSKSPKTGFTRTGYCEFLDSDIGKHNICVLLTQEFLHFTKNRGNDLTKIGLKAGDKWCICVGRWLEAYKYDKKIAPKVDLKSTNVNVLEYVPMEILKKYSI